MNLFVFLGISLLLYLALSWWALIHQKHNPRAYVLATLIGLIGFIGSTYVNAFWGLFFSVLLLAVGAYLAANTQFGPPFFIGLIGALWISVPFYIEHVQNI